MPSCRVSGPNVDLKLFDVLGEDGEPSFIRHTGLAASEGRLPSKTVKVVHMRPPLQTYDEMQADVRGTAELTDSERRKIQMFLDRHAGEHDAVAHLRPAALWRRASEIYCLYPHAIPHTENDGRYVRLRFSCAGFVFEAYKEARIILVDESTVPEIGLDRIKESYPDFAEVLDNRVFRTSMGLDGTGPWRVVLCGYLVHALNRDAGEIRDAPYVSRPGDAYFA